MPVWHTVHWNCNCDASAGTLCTVHWNCILTGSFVVRNEHTGAGVKHIYCYWTWLSVVVVHTWPSLVPGCLAKGRSSQNIKTLMLVVATGRWIEKCSEKRNCRNVAQPRSEPNRSAYLFCRNYCRECRFWCTSFLDCTRLGR